MQDRPEPGMAVELEPGLTRVLAPNPSAFTFWGTNSYLLEDGDLSLIDPGPDDPVHLSALLRAIGDRQLARIVVTHAHRDHSLLAPALSQTTGAPVLAFGGPEAGQSGVMRGLAHAGLAGGGEGVDASFAPDRALADGETVGPFRALHTPGHMGNHLCLVWRDAVFTGDLVMGWSTSLVSPPDGDLTDFMASCRRLQSVPARVFHPGHGAPIAGPSTRLAELIAHREVREAQILAALAEAPGTVRELTARIYTGVALALLSAAERNVFAHLIDLTGRGLAHAEPRLSLTARYRATLTA